MVQLTALSQPIKIGSLTLKHRVIQGPMWTRFASSAGEVTQQMIDYYSARAKGGAAAVIIESTAIDGRYGWPEPTLRLDSELYQPRYGQLIEAIHLHGIPAITQLINVGAFSTNPISPSAVPSFKQGATGLSEPRALSVAEIEELRDEFIATALRAKEVGADGVLVHASTAYLLHHFLSPTTNKRTDKYGGSLEGRMRLPLEIVNGIRQQCGPQFTLGFALVVDEFLPDGLDFETSIPVAKAMEAAGVDYLDLQSGTYETFATTDRSTGHSKHTRFGYWNYTSEFKKAVKIPVFARTAGDYDPLSWEKHVGAGDADVVQVAKPSLCDPNIYGKVISGKLEEIRPCTLCLNCQDTGIVGHHQPQCALNPELGRERDYALQPVAKAKKVFVIGGGPGGLEAARVAAERGHNVTLIERNPELGGKLNYVSLCLDQENFGGFRDWEILQCKKAGVEFKLGEEATAESIREAAPDAVILATGAYKRLMPNIPGIAKRHVVTPEDVLTGKATVGKRVVVIGGNRIGVDIAYTIAKRNMAESVTIVEEQDVVTVGYDMEVLNAAMLTMCLLPKAGVEVYTDTHIEEITDDAVIVVSPEGKRSKMPADTVVISMGYCPDQSLYESLKGQISELYPVGDSVKTRKTRYAVHEAAFAARQI